MQDAYKLFQEAVNGDDVETNEKGELVLHGSTYSYWTTKVPA